MLHPNTKATPPSFLAAVWAGGHTSKQLHPGFPLGVSSQGPPREPSVGPTHHTPSPSHPQISACRRAAHTARKPRAPAPARPALLLRVALGEPRCAARLTSGPCCQLERWLASSRHCCRQHCCCGRDVRVSAVPQAGRGVAPPTSAAQQGDNTRCDALRLHKSPQDPAGNTQALTQAAKVGIVALMLPSHVPLTLNFSMP